MRQFSFSQDALVNVMCYIGVILVVLGIGLVIGYVVGQYLWPIQNCAYLLFFGQSIHVCK